MTIGDALDPAHAAWLIRVPAAGRADVQEWQARNGTLMVDGRRIQTRPAPPTCAKYSCQNGSNPRQLEAAEAQLAWGLTDAARTAPIYLRTTGNDDATRQETAKRLRTVAWTDLRAPGVQRVWEGLLPGIRASLQVWNLGEDIPMTEDFIFALLRDAGNDRGVPAGTLVQLNRDALPNSQCFTRILPTGERMILQMQRGAEIIIETATHQSKCFLLEAKWVCVGVSPTDERRHAQWGLVGDIRITTANFQPLAVWTYGRRPTTTSGNPRHGASRHNADTHRGPTEDGNHGDATTQPDNPSAHLDHGLRWCSPPTISEWLSRGLQETDPCSDANDPNGSASEQDAETCTIREVLRTYTPQPSEAIVEEVTTWVREHALALCRSSVNPPTRWMWEWILYLKALEVCGIAELRQTDLPLHEDLIDQIGVPTWVKTSLPFNQWAKGQRAMKAGHAYTGMKNGSPDRARSIIALAPTLMPATLEGLRRIIDGAMSLREGSLDESSPACPSPALFAPGPPLPPPSQTQPPPTVPVNACAILIPGSNQEESIVPRARSRRLHDRSSRRRSRSNPLLGGK